MRSCKQSRNQNHHHNQVLALDMIDFVESHEKSPTRLAYKAFLFAFLFLSTFTLISLPLNEFLLIQLQSYDMQRVAKITSVEALPNEHNYSEMTVEPLEFLGNEPIQLLLYQEDEMLVNTRSYPGINTTFFGYDRTVDGYGSMFMSVMPVLESLPLNSVVVIAEAQDLFVDMPLGAINELDALSHFKKYFKRMTARKGAVVFPVSDLHCSNALKNVAPGDLFTEKGTRKGRACSKNSNGCNRDQGVDNTPDWSMLLKKHAKIETLQHVFLDSRILAGKVADVDFFLKTANLAPNEDEQAVFMDLFHYNPDLIFLDHNQWLFAYTTKSPQAQSVLPGLGNISQKTASHSLFKLIPGPIECNGSHKKSNFVFPTWKSSGIHPNLITNHINQVLNFGPRVTTEPEQLYVVDKNGIWSCRELRAQLNNGTRDWAASPSETIAARAHKILIEDENSLKWGAIKNALEAGGFPFWHLYSDIGCTAVPMFTYFANQQCQHAFPVPSYKFAWETKDTTERWKEVFDQLEQRYPWETKIRKAVWRGTFEGFSTEDVQNDVRMRLNKMVQEEQDYSHLYDTGITSIPAWVMDFVDIDIAKFGGYVEDLAKNDLQNYMAIIEMDGRRWTQTTAEFMAYNSVLIKVEPKFVQYFWNGQDVKPWVHYIPIKNDLSDLHQNVAWALDPKNEKAVKKIIGAAHQLVARRFLPDQVARDLLDIWEAYLRMLNHGSSKWQEKWKEEHKKLAAESRCGLFQLS